MSVLHTKGGGVVWNCVKYNIIEGKEKYEAIGIRGFNDRFLRKRCGGFERY